MVTAERYRILTVDDNEDVLELIQLTLGQDYDVVTLSNPLDVYEIIDLFEPDLLILDVMMPKVNGFQLTEMLRKNPKTKDLPIIILSAKVNAGDIKHGYRLGATLYLTKPFQPDRLIKNVETQFRLNPPDTNKKSSNLRQVVAQIEVKQSYRKGMIRLSQRIMQHDQVVDVHRKIRDKIVAEEKERKGAQLHWED